MSQAVSGDVEAYLGDEDLPEPARIQHTHTLDGMEYSSVSTGHRWVARLCLSDHAFPCTKGDTVGGGVIAVAAGHRSNDWHLVVKAYGPAPEAKATVSVLASGDGSTVEAQQALNADAPAAELQTCGNCGEAVPAARLRLHQAYCERHNTRCATCGRVVRKVRGRPWQGCCRAGTAGALPLCIGRWPRNVGRAVD